MRDLLGPCMGEVINPTRSEPVWGLGGLEALGGLGLRFRAYNILNVTWRFMGSYMSVIRPLELWVITLV